MNPDTAVQTLASIIAPRTEFSEDQVYAELIAAGVSPDAADRVYKFTMFSWGRAFLDGLGIQFAPEYLVFDANGDVLESGLLQDEPHFAAAERLLTQYRTTPGFAHLALLSADVQTVNQALNNGSNPADLVTSPAANFAQPPTKAGMEKARRHLESLLPPMPEDPASQEPTPEPEKKPWWRFW